MLVTLACRIPASRQVRQFALPPICYSATCHRDPTAVWQCWIIFCLEAMRILSESSCGVLSLIDVDGESYGVPLSHVFDGKGVLYFHSARSGHKMCYIGEGCACSYSVVWRDDVRPEEFTTYFMSVVCAGRITVVGDGDERVKALTMLAERYLPGIDSAHEIERFLSNVAFLRLDVERITGKESIELTRMR
ncbi:MAG TPA: 5-nitroimidazole antibiotic resistance protein [Porphyromonadaceae bacterium]|nr:5-nitroimidazole antibiotic resistance protein [Porphyromonadaceae bacterium]HAP29259.1 5-nitroimidazole antibiotic resistance protein [Porphyromonadaceae bacterium]